jgi:prepilin-type N-terminal cleavage/methylation domain-containing protein/prepilin-type processing-associated H-X9-DG protein
MFQLRSTYRHGVTLLELVVVIAIIGVVVALTVVAVQRVRDSAARAHSQNNVKNITLAVHHLADTQGRLPTVPLDYVNGYWTILKPSRPMMVQILPYLEEDAKPDAGSPVRVIGMYLSPADPTASQAATKSEPATSYAANATAFRQALPIGAAFADGSSNTIAFAEHYAFGCMGVRFLYNYNGLSPWPIHRAAFADSDDVEPVTEGLPPVTRPNTIYPVTFQAAPSLSDCNPRLAQTPHSSGMIVSMCDGSVRIVSPGISSSTYWALVTPRAGDCPGGDW